MPAPEMTPAPQRPPPAAHARPAPGRTLSTILRHDAKTASYKIALLRAIADVALAYPDVGLSALPIAVPLSSLAAFWIAYYWPFAHPARPIWQGRRSQRATGHSSDMAFRDPLARLILVWEDTIGVASSPSDGYLVANELRSQRKRDHYPATLAQAYDDTLAAIVRTIQQPIRYAGPGQWSIFRRPTRLSAVRHQVAPLPNTRLDDLCVIIQHDLWRDFQQLSLWVEALCIHEWCLFSERLDQPAGAQASRGAVYELLTHRPNNRRPLTWERNQVDILLMEGQTFRCPWTDRLITDHTAYDLDHIIPVAVYPMNEVWNLAPSDPRFNQHIKRDRLPSAERLARATAPLLQTYLTYLGAPALARALREDAAARFADVTESQPDLPAAVVTATSRFVERVAEARNIARF